MRELLALESLLVSGIRDPFTSAAWDRVFADPPEARPTAKRSPETRLFELDATPSKCGRRTLLRLLSDDVQKRVGFRVGQEWLVVAGDLTFRATAITARVLEVRTRFRTFAAIDVVALRRVA